MDKSLIVVLFSLFLLFGCTQANESQNNESNDAPIFESNTTTNEDGGSTTVTKTPISQTMSWEDANGSGQATKNLMTNQVIINFTIKYDILEDDPETTMLDESKMAKGMIKEGGLLSKFYPAMVANMLFDYEGLLERLEASGYTATTVYEDEEEPKEDAVINLIDFIKDVEITKINFHLIEQNGMPIFDCVMIGVEEEDRTCTYFGEYKE